MSNEEIKQCWLAQILRRNPPKIRIKHTVYPDVRMGFNSWAVYIRKEVSNG